MRSPEYEIQTLKRGSEKRQTQSGGEARHRVNSLATMPAFRRSRFETCYQQQIDNFDRVVRQADTDRTTRRRLPHKFGMLNRYQPAIGQMNVERLKRPSLMHFSYLFDGHNGIVALRNFEEKQIFRWAERPSPAAPR